jgi:hypothetical protein
MKDIKDMKHWIGYEWTGFDESGNPNPRSNDKIVLKGQPQSDRIVTVGMDEDGDFFIEEACDGWFGASYTKEEMLDLVDELKTWVESKSITPPEDKP